MAKTYHVGYEELKKLVVKVAVQSGMAAPATKPRQTIRQETPKEDGHIRSQKILLTWLIEMCIRDRIKKWRERRKDEE